MTDTMKALAKTKPEVGLDLIDAPIPVAGDVFDLFWKSNDRNAALLAKHVNANPQEERQARRQDWFFVIAVAAGLVMLLGFSIAASWYLLYTVARLFVG